MSDVPKRELTLVGAACALCCAPLVIGVIAAAPAVAAVGGGVAVAAGAASVPRHLRRRPAAADRLP